MVKNPEDRRRTRIVQTLLQKKNTQCNPVTDRTNMDQLFQIRSKLLDDSAQLVAERVKIENMIEATLKSLSEVKASQERMNKRINEILVTKQMDKLIETQFMEVKEQTAKIQNEMESISDATLVEGYNYPDQILKLQVLYDKMQEIGKKVQDYRNSTVLSATMAVQEALAPQRAKILDLQHKYDHLKAQKEIIQLQQDSLEKQLKENHAKITEELQKQRDFCSNLEKMVATYFTVEIDLPLSPHLENLLTNSYNEGPSQPAYFAIPNQARHHPIKPQSETNQQSPPTDNNTNARTRYSDAPENIVTGQNSSEMPAPQGTPTTPPLPEGTEN